MRYVRYRAAGGASHYGAIEGDRVRRVEGDPFGAMHLADETHALAEIERLVPSVPTKVLAVGRNYRSHLGSRDEPKVPELFYKPPSCLVPDGAAIVLPPGSSDVHFEGELVVVLGRRARNVAPGDAMGCVFGLTVGNDVSARDWQKGDLQWWRAKGCDTFGPCGPEIVTGADPSGLTLRTRVNGKVVQEQSTADLIHPIPAIISWASRHVTLEPGDLIYTGTPGQTSALKPGVVVEVEIEGIGVLRNPVVAGA